MDRFSFFFAFYGLILGLAVTELLGGFAGMVRARALRKMELQTGLLALFIFIAICATWIDAWGSLRSISLDFGGLWAPIALATLYYLAAAVVFPSDPADYEDLGRYFAERKRFVAAMLLAAEVLVTFTFLDEFARDYRERPAVFWLWLVPFNLAIKATFVALLFVRGRRSNIAVLVILILLFVLGYWGQGQASGWLVRAFGG